jgi:hypothetical protein
MTEAIRDIVGWFLLILSAGSALALFIRAIDWSIGNSKSGGSLNVTLWALFLLCGTIGLLLLGVIHTPAK